VGHLTSSVGELRFKGAARAGLRIPRAPDLRTPSCHHRNLNRVGRPPVRYGGVRYVSARPRPREVPLASSPNAEENAPISSRPSPRRCQTGDL
jgi:hypothetical protein